MPSTPCPPPPPTPSKPSLPDAVSLNDGSFAFPCSSFLGLRPTKPSPNFHFSHPQNRRSPAEHWRSSPQLPSKKKSPSQFKPTRATTSHPLARLGSPLRFCGLRPTKPSPDFHFSYPQNRRSPAKHWRSSPHLPSKKNLRFSSSRPTQRRAILFPDPAARSDFVASDRQNHHQTVTFHTPKIDDLPQNTGNRRQNAAERKSSASRPTPAASAPLRPQTSVQPRLSQTALCRTNPNKPERSEHPILGQTLAITLRSTANGVLP